MEEMTVHKPGVFEVLVQPVGIGEEGENHVAVRLEVEYTTTYPDTLPELRVKEERGLLPEQMKELEKVMWEEANENVGMPAVFSVVTAIREWLIGRNVRQLTSHEKAVLNKKKGQTDDVEENKQEEKESHVNARYDDDLVIRHGKPFTTEWFKIWEHEFTTHVLEQERQILNASSSHDKCKVTGKEYFEEKALGTGAADHVQYFQVDASLYELE